MTNIKELGEKIVKVITQCKHKECNGCTYFRKEIDSILKSYMAELIGDDEWSMNLTEDDNIRAYGQRNELRQFMRICAGIYIKKCNIRFARTCVADGLRYIAGKPCKCFRAGITDTQGKEDEEE